MARATVQVYTTRLGSHVRACSVSRFASRKTRKSRLDYRRKVYESSQIMASRTDFDAAMANNDIEWLLQNTFMARVPDLIISGMSIEGAIIEAKRQEEKLIWSIIAPSNYDEQEASKELNREMCKRVYNRLRK